MDIPLTITTLNTWHSYETKVLLDSGCTGSCLDRKWVKEQGIKMQPLAHPIPVYNVDGTRNSTGSLTEWAWLKLTIGEHEELMDFGVSDLGKVNVCLGHDWLKIHNPHIDWKKNNIEFDCCPPKCWNRSAVQEPEEEGEESILEEEGQTIAVYIGDKEIRKVSPHI